MAEVYRATDRRLRREVAIKVLPPQLGYSPDLRARFGREAQTAAGLSHPNIVSIYDVGDRDDLVWFVMALVEGESLRAKVEREGPQPIGVVRRVLQQVAQALAYAHARGIVHRDIKPDNILLDAATGRAMVTDFGIAKTLAGGDTALTEAGSIVGTARYMAPEQAMGQANIDGRADMYSLGLVGYFMLFGTHAIKGATLPAVVLEHAREVEIDLGGGSRPLPRPLIEALAPCLAPNPEDRHARMEDVSEALERLGGELPETPAAVRQLIHRTESTFLMVSLAVTSLGIIGTAFVPVSLLMLGSGFLVAQWTLSLERALRSGLTWPALRRALYVERARREEEFTSRQRWAGPISWIVILGLCGGGLLYQNLEETFRVSFGRNVLDLIVMGSGIWGLVAARKFWRGQRTPIADRTGPDRGMVAPGSEWRVPRWLDIAGSWLFGHFVRRGWRIQFQRDQPADETPALDLALARGAWNRITKLPPPPTDSGPLLQHEIRRLAQDLVDECQAVSRQLQPLLAKMARLNEGVLVSRTIAAGGSLEGELEVAEREVDQLRSRGAEALEMLQLLADGLQLAAKSSELDELNVVLARARNLCSAVRRRMEE
jgi:hypothetical protein